MQFALVENFVHLIHLSDKLPAEVVPLLFSPPPALLSRWGKDQHDSRFVYRPAHELRAETVEVQLHLVPHPHRGQTFAEVMHHNEVCAEILRNVVRHGRATLNGISHSCHTRIPVK